MPLTIVGLRSVGGWGGLQDKITQAEALGPLALHPWEGTGVGNVTNPIGANWLSIVFRLGFVLSFGYWTTNFAEVQRALAAKNGGHHRAAGRLHGRGGRERDRVQHRG